MRGRLREPGDRNRNRQGAELERLVSGQGERVFGDGGAGTRRVGGVPRRAWERSLEEGDCAGVGSPNPRSPLPPSLTEKEPAGGRTGDCLPFESRC